MLSPVRLLAVVALVAGTPAVAAVASAPQAGAATSNGYYLALGDSLAAGYQPGVGDDKTGGYVGAVLSHLRASDPSVQLTNLGCSGETTTSISAGGICSYPQGNQLAAATSFLKAHATEQGVITLDIGANDVDSCATTTGIDQTCVLNGLATVQKNLPTIVKTLRALAPHAQIVVLNYYNPFLAAWLTGSNGQSLAKLSAGLQTQLNLIVSGAAGGANAKVANVSALFDSDDFTTTTTLAPFGTIPVNVARICQWTWMCTKANIHANDAGYAVLAKAVDAQLLPLGTSASSTSSAPTSSGAGASSSAATVSGPPVVTDGPSTGNEALLAGAGALAVAGVAGVGLLARRLRR